jgi:hypothetical protein
VLRNAAENVLRNIFSVLIAENPSAMHIAFQKCTRAKLLRHLFNTDVEKD